MIGFREALRVLGTMTGRRAFIGPKMVQIDLTDDCVSNCVGCWARSPFLHSDEKYDHMDRGTLNKEMVLGLAPQLRDLGVESVFFGGGGEPFCHPDVMEIIEAFKLARFQVTINTNFLLVDDQRLEWLLDLRPDQLVVSLWAGTARTYSVHHPNRTEHAFDDITRRLKFLANEKKKRDQEAPGVKLYNVITRYNYMEIPRMIRYGREVGAEVVELAVFDPIPRRTDLFLLSSEQIDWVVKWLTENRPDPPPELWCDQFLRRIQHPDAIDKGAYDNGVYLDTPCFAGWDYARITTTGLVHSCLKSHRIPVGDLKEHAFHDIWFSDTQNEFRRHTLAIDPKDPYLKDIGHEIDFPLPGCFRICDNLGANQARNDQVRGLSEEEVAMIDEMVRAADGGADRAALERIYQGCNPEWSPDNER